jgi:hypothetical protein
VAGAAQGCAPGWYCIGAALMVLWVRRLSAVLIG